MKIVKNYPEAVTQKPIKGIHLYCDSCRTEVAIEEWTDLKQQSQALYHLICPVCDFQTKVHITTIDHLIGDLKGPTK
jgi:hypothetical protein